MYIHNKFDTLKMLVKQIGGLQIILGYSMGLPVLVSLIYGEYHSAIGFLGSSLLIIAIGNLLYRGIKTCPEPQSRHALIIAALGWLFIAIMGAIPFVVIAHITPYDIAQQLVAKGADYESSLVFFKNPLHALFESMSGFTTTGLSMAVHEPSIGKGLLFYRHYIQWLGGAGFIVLTISLLNQSSGRVSFLLYAAESTGERLQSTIIETARAIWKVYLGLTLFCFLILVVGLYFLLPDYKIADNIFDSINHAMAGMSTGGFSTLDNSIADYHSSAVDTLFWFPMILGTLSLPFYVKLFYKKQYSLIWKDLQTRSLLLMFIFGSIILSTMLYFAGNISEPFRIGTFQFISALSTTGWQTCDVHQWDSASITFIIFAAMVIGGSFGATVGGIKIIRVLYLIKGLIWRIESFFASENSVRVVKINHNRLLKSEMNAELASVATFVFIYFVFLFIGTIIGYYTMDSGFSMKDALFESASAQGTVGLSSGITTPGMSKILETTYIFQMWAGRLEIIPVLVLFRTLILGTKTHVV